MPYYHFLKYIYVLNIRCSIALVQSKQQSLMVHATPVFTSSGQIHPSRDDLDYHDSYIDSQLYQSYGIV
jgi:hypothetical protein